MSVAAAIANRLYAAGTLAARRRFERASRNPAAAQLQVLRRILAANVDTEFGARYGFASIRSVDEFRARVPVTSWDVVEPDVHRMARGTPRVRVAEPLRCFEPTGGSSGPNKWIPVTRGLLREFSAATLPWVHDLLANRPALRNGRAYWAVTPPGRTPARTAAGIPIGLEHDSDYFPRFAALLLDRVIGTPRALARAPSTDAWRYLTLRSLLGMDDLAFISVWSPTFLTLLAKSLDEQFDRLIHDLGRGTLSVPLPEPYRAELARLLPARPARARELQLRFGQRPPQDLGPLWPKLALISCWTDAHAARALDAMRARFPSVEVQGKGLLATEGVVSFPLLDAGGAVAAVASHFLEFVPVAGGEAVGVEALERDHRYTVLLTTSGGLYRYRLEDEVRVEGWYRATPLLSFQGRADQTSDLAGEKLSPAFVELVLRDAARECGVHAPFMMLAPALERSRYELLVECPRDDAVRLAEAVERALGTSHHYGLCRRLGQLDAVQAVVVRDGAGYYERSCLARGQRVGTIKPAALGAHFDLTESA